MFRNAVVHHNNYLPEGSIFWNCRVQKINIIHVIGKVRETTTLLDQPFGKVIYITCQKKKVKILIAVVFYKYL